MSSPGVYLRCSENSTEKPWNGDECSPDRKPSTMNFAFRSRRATWLMTSGRRYFSVLMVCEVVTGNGTYGTYGTHGTNKSHASHRSHRSHANHKPQSSFNSSV